MGYGFPQSAVTFPEHTPFLYYWECFSWNDAEVILRQVGQYAFSPYVFKSQMSLTAIFYVPEYFLGFCGIGTLGHEMRDVRSYFDHRYFANPIWWFAEPMSWEALELLAIMYPDAPETDTFFNPLCAIRYSFVR